MNNKWALKRHYSQTLAKLLFWTFICHQTAKGFSLGQQKNSNPDGLLNSCTFRNQECLKNDNTTLSRAFLNMHTMQGCKERCQEDQQCLRWTWYEQESSVAPMSCWIFDTCSLQETQCKGCYSGARCDQGSSSFPAPVILGGVDGSGENVTQVEIVGRNGQSISNLIPDIPSNLAYKNRAAATLGLKIFACGGLCSEGTSTTPQCMYLNFDNLMKLQWKTDVPPMATPRSDASAVGSYGELYVMGGSSADGNKLDSVEVYNPEKKTWRSAPHMPRGRSGHCSVHLAGEIFLVGGETTTGEDYLTVDVYNVTSEQWTSRNMDGVSNIRSHACTVLGSMVLVSGGVSVEGSRALRDVFAMTTDLGSVRKLPEMLVPRYSHGLTVFMSNPYIIGGYDQYSETIKTNEMLENGVWIDKGFLKSARGQFALTDIDISLMTGM